MTKFSLAVASIMVSALAASAQTIQVICSFDLTNGAGPNAALVLGADGSLYGTTTSRGGSSGNGTIFKVATNGALTTLASFNAATGYYSGAAAGYGYYQGLLTLGSDGNFYGTTQLGGSGGAGMVFNVTTNGTLTALASLYDYNIQSPNGLTLGDDGSLYGTTPTGNQNSGTIFKVAANGMPTTLVYGIGQNGAQPYAPLTLGNDGNFYGTTGDGGGNRYGMIFRVTTSGALTSLYSFSNGYDGGSPQTALTLGNDGNFYGTTPNGGSADLGTVFQVTTNGTLTTLASFTGSNGQTPNGLTLGNDGNFYGTTEAGGSSGGGTIFQVTPSGTLTTLLSFVKNGNGYTPPSGLALGADGNFYGTTVGGGSGFGTVFRFSLSPAIAVQPKSQTNAWGATVTFTVSAVSVYPMTYQWTRNGIDLTNGGEISGATTNALTITGISDSDSGSYSLVVGNARGAVTSSNGILTVSDLPLIATQPLGQTVGAGATVTFTANVYGAPPFVFQWLRNQVAVGPPTSGTNSGSLVLADIGTNQSGNYAVQVLNSYGSAVSSNAVLTVIPQPTLTLEISAGYPALNLYGTLANNFTVQYTANVAGTNWINLLSITNLSASPYLFLDPAGQGQPERFYRAFFTH